MTIDQARTAPVRVVVVGAGVAGLETVMALRALLGDRVDVTVIAPEATFVNRSMAVAQPFERQRVRGVRLEAALAEFGARWQRGTVDRVEPARRLVVTRDGTEVPYDFLVLALGARAERRWDPDRVLTYRDGRDAGAFRLLLGWLERRRVRRLAFIRSTGPTWPLPLYDLALMTASYCAGKRIPIEISLVTPEVKPLEVFGDRVAERVQAMLAERDIELYTRSYGAPGRPGRLAISPGQHSIGADAVVALPRLVGPRLRGLPCTANGFIPTDSRGRAPGCADVYAVGDATDFAVKQGGLAAQQADAVATSISAAIGADVDAEPFRPELHAVLMTGNEPRYLSCDLSSPDGDGSAISREPLWWPPTKLCARHLAPFLRSRSGEELDVVA